MTIKALHVIAPGPMAGAEKSSIASVSALAKIEQIQTDLLVISETRCPEHAAAFIAAAANRDINCLQVTTTGRFELRMFLKLNQLLRKNVYDVVHVHSYKALFYFSLLHHRIPALFATYHGTTSHTQAVIAYEWIQWVLFQQVDCVFAVSKGAKAAIESKGAIRTRIAVVPNMLSEPISIKPASLKQNRSNSIELLFMGRLSTEKGLDVLLTALSQLKPMESFYLTVLGDGPKRHELEILTTTMNLNHVVKFVGFQKNIHPYLASADVLVMPSRTEGLPMALIEAAAAGLPVIGSRVGGIPEVVDHETTGLLVKPDNPHHLCESLTRMIKEIDSFKKQSIKKAKKIQSTYHPSRWAETTLREYSKCLKLSM